MSVQTQEPAAPAAGAPARQPVTGRVMERVRAQAMQIVLVWLGIVVLFSVLSPGAFFDPSNFRNKRGSGELAP